jgi:hypothetical protein
MKRFGKILLIVLFLGIIFAIPVATKLQKNEVVSQFENRRLAEVPRFTREGLLSGKYFGQWETYLSDHIFGRNLWIQAYTYLNMTMLGKDNINNIVLGKEGFLLPFFDYDGKYDAINSPENLDKMAQQLKELQIHLKEQGGSLYFIGIPSQASYHRMDYPSHLLNNNHLLNNIEQRLFGDLEKLGLPYINMNTVFRKNDGVEYYYKTDHHYNFEGAYTTYYEIVKTLKQNAALKVAPPLEREDLDIETLPNPFGGSRNRQIYYMIPTQERVRIARIRKPIPYEKYTNGKQDQTLYYTRDNASDRINYGVYMGGDWAETVIKTKNTGLSKLLVFGDSFTNAIEPLLFNNFSETRILDLRYYNKMSLYKYIDKYKPDAVILVRDDLNYGSLEGNGGFKGENIK